MSSIGTIEDAIKIAVTAHNGQLDKQDQPYILHPLRVMLQMNTDIQRIVAVLHDVIEDCGEEYAQAIKVLWGEDSVVWKSLDSVTNRSGETYKDFIRRTRAGGLLAIRVKLADMQDNSRADRAKFADILEMIASRYVWGSTYLVTKDEARAREAAKYARERLKLVGEHPGRYVLTWEDFLKEERFDD